MTATEVEEVMRSLARVKAIVKEIEALRGFRSVAWRHLRDELRESAAHVETMARSIGAWRD